MPYSYEELGYSYLPCLTNRRVLLSEVATRRTLLYCSEEDTISSINEFKYDGRFECFGEFIVDSMGYYSTQCVQLRIGDSRSTFRDICAYLKQISSAFLLDKPIVCADCNSVMDCFTGRCNTDDEDICSTCSENYTVCLECSDVVRTEDASEDMCQGCYDDTHFTCEDCEDVELNNERRTTYDERAICANCYRHRYSTCHGCDRIFPDDDINGSYCDGCSEEESDNDTFSDSHNLVHGYSYKPYPTLFGKGPLYFGVELEVNTHESYHAREVLDSLGEKHVYLKEDGSISSGFEIVTHPHSYEEQVKLWEPFFDDVPDGMTSYKSGECGMHVHLSRAAFTDLHLRKFVVFIHASANTPYIEAVAQRGYNSYSRRYDKTVVNALDQDCRYEAVNLLNDKTIEVRIFRGTVRKDRFYKNLEFMSALYEFTKDVGFIDLTGETFCFWVEQHKNRFRYLYNFNIEKGFSKGKILKHSKNPASAPVQDLAA